jgi:hypothetical protein
LESARRVIEEALREKVDFVVVAGDTFENNGVDRIKVREVAKILGGAGCPVYLISGNHDALTPGSVWEDAVWGEFPNVHVLRKAEPVEVGGAVVYPAEHCGLTCPKLVGQSDRSRVGLKDFLGTANRCLNELRLAQIKRGLNGSQSFPGAVTEV